MKGLDHSMADVFVTQAVLAIITKRLREVMYTGVCASVWRLVVECTRVKLVCASAPSTCL